jgi:hypothetical protein
MFANKINKKNWIKGFTVAFTTHGKSKSVVQNVLPHSDKYNSHCPNFNYILIASSIGELSPSKWLTVMTLQNTPFT